MRGLTLAAAVVVVVSVTGGDAVRHATASDHVRWKGAETLNPLSLGPAPERCGEFPRFIEARFAGEGIDTQGGPYAVTASGCLDTETFDLFDLEATDTYLDGSGAVLISPADSTLVLDEGTCVATNVHPIPFAVAGGTGTLEGASGAGTFDMAFTWPPCSGVVRPAHVWFSGEIHVRP